MICVRCCDINTVCVDDMLQVNYIAEVYRCNSCNGIIEVEYDGVLGLESVKSYTYRKTNPISECDS